MLKIDSPSSAIILPQFIRNRFNNVASNLMSPPGLTFDFSSPEGEEALLPPDSHSWQVFKNPLTSIIGGVAAVIMELAEPRIRTGVWEHTNFRTDPLKRLGRTGLAAMVTVYGPHSKAENMIMAVNRAHEKVKGTTPDGQAYSAMDKDLLNWVQRTASFGFIEAYHTYVRPFSEKSLSEVYQEGTISARLYGADDNPSSKTEQEKMFAKMLPYLEPHPIIGEFQQIMRETPIVPAPFNLLQGALLRAAVDIIPQDIRDVIGLDKKHGLRPGEKQVVKLAARLSDRIFMDSHPAIASSVRLGLPEDYLFRDPSRGMDLEG